jgi:hypothetical protein
LKFTKPTINLPKIRKINVFPKSSGVINLVNNGSVKILIPKEENEAIK